MKITRKLFYFSLANFIFACVLCAMHPRGSTFHYLAEVLLARAGTDSTRFMDQAWSTLQSGAPLYQTLFFTKHIKFIYPTSSLLIYFIAQIFHFHAALFVRLLVLLCFPGTLFLAGEIFLAATSQSSSLDKKQRLQVRALIALLGAIFCPLTYGVYLGQVQTLLTFLWTLSVYLWLQRKKALCGICIALICTFKPMLAVFFLWAFLRKQWRFLIYFAGSALLIQISAGFLFGWRNQLDYLSVLNYLSHRGEALFPNQTINGLLERLTGNGNMTNWSDTVYPPYNRLVYFGTLSSTIILYIFGLLVPILRRWKDSAFDFILFGMISTIASPIAWEHHYGYFFIGCIYFLAFLCMRETKIPYLFLACFLALANAWTFLSFFATYRWNLLSNFELYAALSVILMISFSQDVGRERSIQFHRPIEA